MNINLFVKKLKRIANGEKLLLAQFADVPAVSEGVDQTMPPGPGHPPKPPPPSEIPQTMPPEATGQIYDVEFKPWRKPFFDVNTKKRVWKIKGYFLNVKGVDRESDVGKLLIAGGFKYKDHPKFGSAFSLQFQKSADIPMVKKVLDEIETVANCKFSEDWIAKAEEFLSDTAPEEIDAGEVGGMDAIIDNILKSQDLTNEAKEEKLKKHVRRKLDELSKLTDEAKKNEILIKLLAGRGKFHRYSFLNTFLMMLQNPDVSNYVTGGKGWERDFGRQVREGEKSMEIFAPRSYRMYKTNIQKLISGIENLIQTMGGQATVKNGTELISALGINNNYISMYIHHVFNRTKGNSLYDIMKTMERDLNNPKYEKMKSVPFGVSKNFDIVNVYDIEQTDPVTPDAFKPPTEEEFQWQAKNQPDDKALILMGALYAWAETEAKYKVGSEWKQGIKTDLIKNLSKGHGGWSSGAEVAINSMSEGWRQLGTGIHEVAHTLLHWGPDKGELNSMQMEIEAEAVDFIVLSHFGYTDTGFAANYLALKGATKQDVLDRYEKIDIASRQIVNGITRILKSQGKKANWFTKIKIASYLK